MPAFKIERLPLVKISRKLPYPFSQLEIGECFSIPITKKENMVYIRSKLGAALAVFKKNNPTYKFASRSRNNERSHPVLTVWRIA